MNTDTLNRGIYWTLILAIALLLGKGIYADFTYSPQTSAQLSHQKPQLESTE
jgi:hypothetical protein